MHGNVLRVTLRTHFRCGVEGGKMRETAAEPVVFEEGGRLENAHSLPERKYQLVPG
jgi:hypothetical protein